MVTELTYSSIRSFLECPLKFFYSYIKKIKPVTTPRPLSVGAAFHSAVEQIDKTLELKPGIDEIDKYFQICHDKILESSENPDEDLAENQERWNESKRLATFYFTEEHFRKPYTAIKYEYEGKVYFTNPNTGRKIRKYPFRFKVDGVCTDDHGNWWILERKTAATIDRNYLKFLSLDLQSILYLAALRIDSGKNFAGVIYEISSKQLPSKPKLLKNGTLSVAKNQNTTVKLYKEAIKDHELEESDYREFLEWLEENQKKYFHREWLVPTFNINSVSRLFDNVRNAINVCDRRSIVNNEGFYQNLTSCVGFGACQFFNICTADDKSFIIENFFENKKSVHEELNN